MIKRLFVLFFLGLLMAGSANASISPPSLPVTLNASSVSSFQSITASSLFQLDADSGIKVDGVFSGLIAGGNGSMLDVTISELINEDHLVTLFTGHYDGSPFTDSDTGYMSGKTYLISATGVTGLSGGEFSLTVSAASASVPVSATPVPAAAWLFGSALFGFVAYSRRNKI
jgi:hypothetical protein